MQQVELLEQRDYQTDIPAKVAEKLRQTMRALIVMATGLGKTITCGLTVQEYFKHVNSFRVLYLCDRTIALDQAEKEFLEKLEIKVKPARFYASNQARGGVPGDRSIVFASFQKLSSAREWYKQFPYDHFDLIVVDEAHHAFAPTYYEVIRYFQTDPCPLLGMTATPYRSDQKDIKHLFGPPVVEISLEEGIAMGWLADLEYQILSDELDEEKLDKIISGEIRIYRGRKPGMRSLNNTLFIRKRDEEIAKHIKLHSSQGRKTLIFCQSIAQADWFCPFLGPAAQVFHSSRNKAKNEIALREFKEGPIKYLLVVDKLNEAFDMPEVEVVIFLRSTDSKRIFFQQLGRGLRKTRTKRKVLVLDFVANCERLMYLATLASNIKRFSEEKLFQENSVPGTEFNVFVKTPKKPKSVSSVEEKAIFAIDGKNFNFAFTHKIVKAMGVLKMIREGYYPTWQQAAEAAKNLGFSSAEEYRTGYYKDPRLPSSPPSAYSDFPSWLEFFGKEKREFYLTWQEASKAAIALGIKSGRDYGDRKKYKADSKLPALPEVYYSDFPGYLKFLGKELYKSWQECSVAVIALGVKSSDDYGLNLKRYREADPGLPNRPSRYYKDFPGWSIFLNRDDFYPTWQKASASAISLGIKRPREYRGKCDTDSRLPKQPQHFYDSFPGWEKFLKFKKIKKYSTWQEASKSVVRLGIGDWEEYRVNYKKDPRLPAGPTGFYSNYPGPEKFFGKK